MRGVARRSRAPRSQPRTVFAILRFVLIGLDASANRDDVPRSEVTEDFLGYGLPRPITVRSVRARHSTVPAASPPHGGAVRAKPRRFPLPGAEVQQQRREWLLPGLRSVNQRLEHGTKRRRMKADLCTVQEVPE
jgi:hypothetical protein